MSLLQRLIGLVKRDSEHETTHKVPRIISDDEEAGEGYRSELKETIEELYEKVLELYRVEEDPDIIIEINFNPEVNSPIYRSGNSIKVLKRVGSVYKLDKNSNRWSCEYFYAFLFGLLRLKNSEEPVKYEELFNEIVKRINDIANNHGFSIRNKYIKYPVRNALKFLSSLGFVNVESYGGLEETKLSINRSYSVQIKKSKR